MTDMETNCLRKKSLLFTVPERRELAMQGHTGGTGVDQEAGGVRGKHGHEPLLWFLGERQGKTGSADLGLASLNNFRGSGLQGWSLIVWYLALGDLG